MFIVKDTDMEGEKFKINNKYKIRIRRLTPKECWRLMGFTDDDYDRASKVNSNTQLYKQAGNSICVPCLESVFRSVFRALNMLKIVRKD